MTQTSHHVVAVGNAIVDVIARATDDDLRKLNVIKGQMALIEEDQIAPIYAAMSTAIEISGGSAANTMAGVASFGGDAAFIGKVADDEFGHIFMHDLNAIGVTCRNSSNGVNKPPTARSLIFVTPDGERTMNTYLGISPLLTEDDIHADLIRNAEITYLEGYLYDRDQAKHAFHSAADIARNASRRVALSLSDAFCVDRHRDAFRHVIQHRTDILFANEAEILSLFEVTTLDQAVTNAHQLDCLTAITRGPNGSIVLDGGKILEIPAKKCPEVVDTTGAGDLYAAGFLYGLTHGASLERCAELGSIAATEIIGHIGARPEASLNLLVD